MRPCASNSFAQGAAPPLRFGGRLCSHKLSIRLTVPTASQLRIRYEARLVANFCRLFSRMREDDLGLVLFMAQKMAKRKAV
jgi:hypothetical protein